MRHLIAAPALTATLVLALTGCGNDDEVTVGAASSTGSSSSSSSSTDTGSSSSSASSSSESSSSSSSASGESSSSASSSSASAGSSTSSKASETAPPLTAFKDATGPDKDGILSTARTFAAAVGRNDTKGACATMAAPDGTPIKGDPLLLPECEKSFKEKLGGQDAQAKQIRLVYSKMTFDKASTSGKFGLATPSLYGKVSESRFGLIKSGDAWYMDINRLSN